MNFKFVFGVTLGVMSFSALADNCKVILKNGFDQKTADFLKEKKGFELVDEGRFPADSVWFFLSFQEVTQKSGVSVFEMRFKRDLETLFYRSAPISSDRLTEVSQYLEALPTCFDIYQNY